MIAKPPPNSPLVLAGKSLPHALRDLRLPPSEAFLWGRLPPGPRIGLVGTREPSARGFRIAFEVARALAELGMTIVSGGALGIDRAAHLGALRARGSTLVVAPLWFDRSYPQANRRLFAQVLARGGGYVTVAPHDARPIAHTFRRRNEILVALCDVLLCGETGTPSGALMAGAFARQAGVPQLLLPWSHHALDLRGTQVELERGARGYFNPVQVIRLLEGRIFENPTFWERSARAVQERKAALDEKDRRKKGKGRKKTASKSSGSQNPRAVAPSFDDPVMLAIADGGATIDAIAERTRLAAAVVQHRVLRLTLEGAVHRDGSGLLRVSDGMESPSR